MSAHRDQVRDDLSEQVNRPFLRKTERREVRWFEIAGVRRTQPLERACEEIHVARLHRERLSSKCLRARVRQASSRVPASLATQTQTIKSLEQHDGYLHIDAGWPGSRKSKSHGQRFAWPTGHEI